MEVPPLRERKSDIQVLVNYFIEDIAGAQGRPVIMVTSDAIEQLKQYHWSGNVRELHNVVERLLILCSGEITKENIKRFVEPLML